ncbi:MAG: outer membrane beta-barrel protein [Rhodothermales bacterium]
MITYRVNNMLKGTILIATTLLIFAVPRTGHSQGLGVSVGANFNDLSDINAGNREETFENASGWHVHLWLDLPLGPVALRPGIRYMDLGNLFEDSSIEDRFSAFDPDQAVALLEIPIDVRIRLGLPLISPYVLAGPVLRFPTETGEENQFQLKSFSVAAGVGVGVEIGLVGFRLYPELKYTFGITRFTEEEFRIGGVTFEADDDQRLNAIMLSLGVGL